MRLDLLFFVCGRISWINSIKLIVSV
jgi:hypothetical protein